MSTKNTPYLSAGTGGNLPADPSQKEPPKEPRKDYGKAPRKNPRRSLLRTILKALFLTLAGIILLLTAGLLFINFYFTPQRLTSLINKEASDRLNADIHASDIRYTLWSTFPRLAIKTDSLTVISRTLDSIPADIRRQLPDNADSLLSLKAFEGEINIIDFLSKRFVIHNLKVDGLKLNLAAYNDSINNYNIIPEMSEGFKSIPYFTANSLTVTNARAITYYSAATDASASLRLSDFTLTRTERSKASAHRPVDRYRLTIGGKITAEADNLRILSGFPFLLSGDISLAFLPFALTLSDYAINLGNVRGTLSMQIGMGDNPALNSFHYRLAPLNLMTLLGYIPEKLIPEKYLTGFSGTDSSLEISASARLTAPWHFSSQYLPSIEVDVSIPEGSLYSVNHSAVNGAFLFNGRDPAASIFRIYPFTLSADEATVTADATASDLNSSPLVNIGIACRADLHEAARSLAELLPPLAASGKLDCRTAISFRLDGPTYETLRDIRIDGTARLNKTHIALRDSTLDARTPGLTLKYTATADRMTRDGIIQPRLKGILALPSADVRAGKDEVAIGGLSASLDIKRRNIPYRPSTTRPAYKPAKKGLKHTPDFITFNLPDTLRDIMARYDYTLKAGCRRIALGGQDYLTGNCIEHAAITLTPDRLTLHSLAAEVEKTPLRLSATVDGLRDFCIDTAGPRPLDIDLDASLGTVNINRLAKAYFDKKGGMPVKSTTYGPAPSDSVAVIIPRNINARIRASVKETVYTNLHLYDLAGGISIAGGNASVDSLKIASDFGKGALSLRYDTANLDSMAFAAKAAVTDVNVVNFFKNFHALLLMMPEMKNLDGNLSVYADASGLIFPDMVINVPSLRADLNLQGKELTVHQNRFIRRVTRMMMIHNADDLHIADMNVYAHVHGNLLQLDPFIFSFDSYKLRMMGINNFNGNLYYHIAVLRNPLHLPFAINIEGLFHNPTLRFGGTRFDTRRGLEISQSIMEQNNVNIVGMMRNFAAEFLQKAAEAATDPSLSL